jgi:hypothetical protein
VSILRKAALYPIVIIGCIKKGYVEKGYVEKGYVEMGYVEMEQY